MNAIAIRLSPLHRHPRPSLYLWKQIDGAQQEHEAVATMMVLLVRTRPWALVVVVVMVALSLLLVAAEEERECTSAYNYLAGCLTFVSGPDVIPSPVCCGGVNHLSTTDPHCLCTIILELDDNPSVNFTKACALAYQCSAAVSFTECGGLLASGAYPLAPMLPPGYLPLPGDEGSAVPHKPPPPLVHALLLVFLSLLFFS